MTDKNTNCNDDLQLGVSLVAVRFIALCRINATATENLSNRSILYTRSNRSLQILNWLSDT